QCFRELWGEKRIVGHWRVIVQVGARAQADRRGTLVESCMSVFQVLGILPDLNGGVQNVPLTTSDPAAHYFVRFGVIAALPLFEFHDDGVVAEIRVLAANHAIEPL